MKKENITTCDLKVGMKIIVEREQRYASSGACKCRQTIKEIVKVSRPEDDDCSSLGGKVQVSFKEMYVPGTKAFRSYVVQVDDSCGEIYRFLGWDTSYSFIGIANN